MIISEYALGNNSHFHALVADGPTTAKQAYNIMQ
jgi:hypothetical protein